MPLPVKIPPLGESISSGLLARWHVKNGDTVRKHQPLFELETDKITSEALAEVAGVVTLEVAEGAEVKVGQLVATIEPAAEPPPINAPAPAKAGSPASPAATPPPPAALPISPAVRRLAAETHLDPATIAGTGKAGRVTKGDLLAAATATAATPPPRPESTTQLPGSGPRSTRRKLTPIRARIAERLVAAKNQTAMLTTFNEVDMTAVRERRARFQEDFTRRHGVKLGFMSFFVKAVVHALREVPQVNALLDGDEIVQHQFYDIGVAVSTDRGLMVPVLRGCDTLDMPQIEQTLAAYATKAREGRIALEDLQGGGFTITNGGTFGSLLSTPILNPPQCGILGMHAIQDRPVALNGQVAIRPMMYLALSYDHRIVDGREAVTFLVKVKQSIEDPDRLLLGV